MISRSRQANDLKKLEKAELAERKRLADEYEVRLQGLSDAELNDLIVEYGGPDISKLSDSELETFIESSRESQRLDVSIPGIAELRRQIAELEQWQASR